MEKHCWVMGEETAGLSDGEARRQECKWRAQGDQTAQVNVQAPRPRDTVRNDYRRAPIHQGPEGSTKEPGEEEGAETWGKQAHTRFIPSALPEVMLLRAAGSRRPTRQRGAGRNHGEGSSKGPTE